MEIIADGANGKDDAWRVGRKTRDVSDVKNVGTTFPSFVVIGLPFSYSSDRLESEEGSVPSFQI